MNITEEKHKNGALNKVIVTGGAGFIGSNLVRFLINHTDATVITVDNLTYAGNLESLNDVFHNPRHHFEKVDICDKAALSKVFKDHQPDAAIHLAAESHVDRSIDGPAEFLQTNIMGTYVILETALEYWNQLHVAKREAFRFLHVSTDEVFGSLGSTGFFTEDTVYKPNSPYAASKASADHLVRAWHQTYGLPVITSNCSNNYGPYQFPEKLIPLMIINGVAGKTLPLYGDGCNVRDWLYVEDHVQGLWTIASHGKLGETYNIGGNNERSNLEVVRTLCEILDDEIQDAPVKPHAKLISYVKDRPGHDRRYAISAEKLASELGWVPKESFESGLRRTVRWYLDNKEWWRHIQEGAYSGERLGVVRAKEST